MNVRLLALASALALVLPAAANAQRQGGGPPRAVPRAQESPAYRAGYERGVRGGEDDGRRNQRFDFESKSDWRGGDYGYRRDYGDRNRYRIDFRLGFEFGYREGYGRYRGNGGQWRPGSGGPPPWANGRGRGAGGYQRTDLAFRSGFTDGYEAGLKDARDRRRFDPIGEGRYRDGDRGYNRNYGSRDFYKIRYREGFREGYEHGYDDGFRYGRNYNGRPSWWPW